MVYFPGEDTDETGLGQQLQETLLLQETLSITDVDWNPAEDSCLLTCTRTIPLDSMSSLLGPKSCKCPVLGPPNPGEGNTLVNGSCSTWASVGWGAVDA